MTWALHGWLGWRTALVWLFLMGWSIYAAEIAATFAPEYHDTRRDTTIALRSAGVFTLLVAFLFPLGVGGTAGVPPLSAQEGEFYVTQLTKMIGSGGASVIIVLLIGSLFLSMISSTADGSRALYGIARDDMTVKQLYHLNKYHVPSRAMTVDLVVNVLLVLFISSNIAILYMSNIGYVLAHFLALTGFLLLRRDRPRWPRPIKVGSIWVFIAAVLAVYNAILIGFGIAFPSLTGYGTFTDMWIGVGVLVGSVLLFFFRRLVQDKSRITFREQVPDMPSAEQMRLLAEEAAVAAD
jgi:amino acid transporter